MCCAPPLHLPLILGNGTSTTGKQIVRTHLQQKKRWQILSAGNGDTGERLYSWAWVATHATHHWLLIRTHLTTGTCAYRLCFTPHDQPVTLRRLVAAAGLR